MQQPAKKEWTFTPGEPKKLKFCAGGEWIESKTDKYMDCYEYVLNNSRIPWTIVPVDKRWYRDYIVSKTMVEAMEKLNMEYPDLSPEDKQQFGVK